MYDKKSVNGGYSGDNWVWWVGAVLLIITIILARL